MNSFTKIAMVTLLASCQSAYVSGGKVNFTADEADDFKALPIAEIGILTRQDPDIPGLVGDIAVRGSSGSDEFAGLDVDIDSVGLRTGIRYYFDTGTPLVQPYIGGGLLAQHTWLKTNIDGDSADKTSIGGIGMIGVESQFDSGLRLGLGYQLTTGIDPKIDGEKVDLDSGAFMFTLGWSF